MITVDDTSPMPPFEQIRTQVADGIRSGQLAAGQRLPSVRQLAGDLRVAAGTVARAYSQLESDGLIESSRSTGTTVRPNRAVPEGARDAAKAFIDTVRGYGLDLENALSTVRTEWAPVDSGTSPTLRRS